MAKLDVEILGFCVGDDIPIDRTYKGQPLNVALERAWLMVKNKESDADANAVVNLVIFPTLSAPGILTKSNSGSEGTFIMTFNIPKSVTDTMRALKPYFFGIKILTLVGQTEHTMEKGTIVLEPKIIEGV